MAQLGLVVMVVGLGTDLDFLDLHHALALFGFLLLFLLLVLELAVVHDAAHGRFRIRGDFNKIKPLVVSNALRLRFFKV